MQDDDNNSLDCHGLIPYLDIAVMSGIMYYRALHRDSSPDYPADTEGDTAQPHVEERSRILEEEHSQNLAELQPTQVRTTITTITFVRHVFPTESS